MILVFISHLYITLNELLFFDVLLMFLKFYLSVVSLQLKVEKFELSGHNRQHILEFIRQKSCCKHVKTTNIMDSLFQLKNIYELNVLLKFSEVMSIRADGRFSD